MNATTAPQLPIPSSTVGLTAAAATPTASAASPMLLFNNSCGITATASEVTTTWSRRLWLVGGDADPTTTATQACDLAAEKPNGFWYVRLSDDARGSAVYTSTEDGPLCAASLGSIVETNREAIDGGLYIPTYSWTPCTASPASTLPQRS